MLAAGLADPPRDAQRAFRRALEAIAHPGRIVLLPDGMPRPPEGMACASFALALTLLDIDTTFWLDATLAAPAIEESLRFHCGSRRVTQVGDADFAFLGEARAMADLAVFKQGEAEYPDRSASLVVQVAGLDEGEPLRLAGPGIEGTTELRVRGLPQGFPAIWNANAGRFPLGVDLFLVAGWRLAALPRSCRVED